MIIFTRLCTAYNKDLIFLLQDRVPTANSQFQPVASWRNRWNGRTSPSPPPCPRDSSRRTSSKTSIGPKRPYRRREVRWRGIWDLFAVSIQFRRWEIVCLLSVSAVKKNVIKNVHWSKASVNKKRSPGKNPRYIRGFPNPAMRNRMPPFRFRG